MSSKSLYLFWTRLKWLKITHFLFGKLYTTVVEDQIEKWYELSNKSEITGFCTGKNSKFTWSFSWGCFMWHRLSWFLWCCFWSPYFFNCPFCGRLCCETKIICIYQLLKQMIHQYQLSLLSPLLPQPLILGNSLPKYCVADGCWFSSISHFAMLTKSINDCTILSSILTIYHSRVMHWQLAAFTVLINWLLGRFVSCQ